MWVVCLNLPHAFQKWSLQAVQNEAAVLGPFDGRTRIWSLKKKYKIREIWMACLNFAKISKFGGGFRGPPFDGHATKLQRSTHLILKWSLRAIQNKAAGFGVCYGYTRIW